MSSETSQLGPLSSAEYEKAEKFLIKKAQREDYHVRYHHMYLSTISKEIKQKFIVPRLKLKLKELLEGLVNFAKIVMLKLQSRSKVNFLQAE